MTIGEKREIYDLAVTTEKKYTTALSHLQLSDFLKNVTRLFLVKSSNLPLFHKHTLYSTATVASLANAAGKARNPFNTSSYLQSLHEPTWLRHYFPCSGIQRLQLQKHFHIACLLVFNEKYFTTSRKKRH